MNTEHEATNAATLSDIEGVLSLNDVRNLWTQLQAKDRDKVTEAFHEELRKARAEAERIRVRSEAEVARIEGLKDASMFFNVIAEDAHAETPEALIASARAEAKAAREQALGRIARKPKNDNPRHVYALYLDGKLSASVNTAIEAEAIARKWRSNAAHAGKTIILRNNITATESTFA